MKRFDYIITGCGLSGLMLAYRMCQDSYFRNKTILLIDSHKKTSDDRTWSFWEKGKGDWDDLIYKSWDRIQVKDNKIDKNVSIKPYIYKTIKSSSFYDFMWKELESKKNITIKFDKVLNISHKVESASVLTVSSEYHGKKLFNSISFDRRYNQQINFPVLNQHFVGWFIETEEDYFDDSVTTFMDFSVEQANKTRFMYILPFQKNEALIEYTLFSEKLLPRYEYDEELKYFLKNKGIEKYKITKTEVGSIPMTCYRFWRQNSSNVLYIGTVGGWTKPSTGFTFYNSVKKTKRLIEFLKKENDLKKFRKSSRFWFYDLLFLDLLYKENEIGSKLFVRLFKRNKPNYILKFLDEETNLFQEIKILLTMPWFKFNLTLFRRILKSF